MIVSIYSMKLTLSFGFYGSTSILTTFTGAVSPKKYALNIIFLTRDTVFSFVAQWVEDCLEHWQSEFKPQLFRFVLFPCFFFFSFATVCLSFCFVFFLIIFCFLVCLSFIPTAARLSELHAELDKTPQRKR